MENLTLQGRLVADAAVRQSNGRSFLSFTIACNRTIKREESTNYYNVTWNNYNEGMVQYLTKGKPITIIGEVGKISVEVSSRDGKTYPRVDVRAFNVSFIPFGTSGNTATVNEGAAPVAQPVVAQFAPTAQPVAQPAPVQPTAFAQPTPAPVAPQPSVFAGQGDAVDDLPF